MAVFDREREQDEVLASEDSEQFVARDSTSAVSQSNSSIAARAAQARANQENGEELESGKPKKAVSGAAMKRINQAKEAIDHAKEVFEFGAGNQAPALLDTNMNSYYRMKVVRESSYWTLTNSVRALAANNPEALAAAKCDIAQGGNCGEHSKVAFDYLRATATGETINRSTIANFDHAFVILGDQTTLSDSELVVSDPWPTAPTACLWEDHFAHSDREQIVNYSTVVADGQNVKEVIKAGLSLSATGHAFLRKKDSDRRTKKRVEDGLGGWVWNHAEAAAEDHDFDYYTTDEESDADKQDE